MKYFDVLLTVSYGSPEDGSVALYKVQCVQWESREQALKSAARWVRRRKAKDPSEVWTVLDAQPAGAFDNFVGKYVGQFIDEAFELCQKDSSQ